MKKQKSNLKNKLKDVWSKIKHPLIYVSFALNILFIAIAIVGCIVPSKSDGSYTSNDSEISQIVRRKNMLNDNETISDLTNTTWVFGSSVGWSQPDGRSSMSVNFSSNDESFNSFWFYKNTSPYQYQIAYNGANLRSVFYKQFSSSQSIPVTIPFSSSANENYKIIHFIDGNDIQNSSFISWLYSNATLVSSPDVPDEPEEPEDVSETLSVITLNDSFVPSVYVAQNGEYIFNGLGGKVNNVNTFYLDFDGFTFKSNGETYNRVRLPFVPMSSSVPYVTQDGSTGVDTSQFSGYVICLGVIYQYVDDGDVTLNTIVARPRRQVIRYNGVDVNAYDSRSPFLVWVNDNYRQLEIIEDTQSIISNSYLIYSNMTSIQLLQITSNVNQGVTGFTNVTDLFKSAFSSFSNLLQMNILPGITIGLLLFIPLIVTIILTILKLVKK